MIATVEEMYLDVPTKELTEYVKQKEGFQQIASLCAGTVKYEYEVKQILSLLPSVTMIKEFNEREKERLKDNTEELKRLDENLEKKLASHAKITNQIATQVKSAKQFRQDVIDIFGALEKGSVLCAFIWSTICGQKFTDKCLDTINKKQLVDIKEQMVNLAKLKDELQLMNAEAIDSINEEMKNIVDGGSDDLKKAMQEFQRLTDEITDKEKKLDQTKRKYEQKINTLNRTVDEVLAAVSAKEDSDQFFKSKATELLAECNTQKDKEQERKEALNSKHQQERTTTTKKLQNEQDQEIEKQKQAFSNLKDASAEAHKKHYEERVEQIKANNQKVEEQRNAHEKELLESIQKYKDDLQKPIPESTVDYKPQLELAQKMVQEGQTKSQIADEYKEVIKTVESGGFFSLFSSSKSETKEFVLSKDNSAIRQAGVKLIEKGTSQINNIQEKKQADERARQQIHENQKFQYQNQIDKLMAEVAKLKTYYVPEQIPEMTDQTEAQSKNFEETTGFQALNASLTQKNESIIKQLQANQDYEQTTLADTIKNEESHIIQQALAFIEKFQFKNEVETLAQVIGCLVEVINNESPQQISDDENIVNQKQNMKDAQNEISQNQYDKERDEERAKNELKQLREELNKAAIKLSTYKDSSPVPLDSLLSIYEVMGNIRGRQDNVTNIRQLIPNCIVQFNTVCKNMISTVEDLKDIEAMSDDEIKKELSARIGNTYNKKRKDQTLIKEWVEEIVGEDEEFEPIIQILTKQCKALPYKSFKEVCEDDEKRTKFVQKCAKVKPSEDAPKLDEDQLDQLESILESIADNIIVWERDYYAENTPNLKYMERYKNAHNGFKDLVKQIRFMPNTRQICSEIIEEIAKVEQKGELAYQKIIIPDQAIQGEFQMQQIKEGAEQ